MKRVFHKHFVQRKSQLSLRKHVFESVWILPYGPLKRYLGGFLCVWFVVTAFVGGFVLSPNPSSRYLKETLLSEDATSIIAIVLVGLILVGSVIIAFLCTMDRLFLKKQYTCLSHPICGSVWLFMYSLICVMMILYLVIPSRFTFMDVLGYGAFGVFVFPASFGIAFPFGLVLFCCYKVLRYIEVHREISRLRYGVYTVMCSVAWFLVFILGLFVTSG